MATPKKKATKPATAKKQPVTNDADVMAGAKTTEITRYIYGYVRGAKFDTDVNGRVDRIVETIPVTSDIDLNGKDEEIEQLFNEVRGTLLSMDFHLADAAAVSAALSNVECELECVAAHLKTRKYSNYRAAVRLRQLGDIMECVRRFKTFRKYIQSRVKSGMPAVLPGKPSEFTINDGVFNDLTTSDMGKVRITTKFFEFPRDRHYALERITDRPVWVTDKTCRVTVDTYRAFESETK